MDQTIAEEYRSSLNDLNFNSKPLINMLTMLADENKKHAATIVKTIVNHINSAPLEAKLPGLYLVDSIMKNLGDEYMKIFCQQIVSLFTSVFEKVDENTRSLMFKLRQTWTDILPNKILYNLDVSVKKLDPAWPITAKVPPKRILVNPKFVGASVEEKKTSQNTTDSTPIMKEEDQIKQKQGEVLKQLLAKQEQLRQLEFQKFQMSMKKKNTAIGSNVPASNSFKKNLRDPRMVKINVSQNASPTKTSSTRAVQEKFIVCKPEVCPNISSNPNSKNVNSSTKCHIHMNSVSNVNVVEQLVKPSEHNLVQLKKMLSKNKTDKNTSKEISHKINEELKCSLTQSAANTSKTDISPVKLPEKTLKDLSKGSKSIPKKKNISDNNKTTPLTINAPGDIIKKKTFHMKTLKKSEKQKYPLKSDSSNNIDNKVVSKTEKEQKITDFSDSINLEMKIKNTKVNIVSNKSKSVKRNDFQNNESDLSIIADKDEDLRVKPTASNEDTAAIRISKYEKNVESASFSVEMDNLHPPRKKIKSDDAENNNPDDKSETPVLFGSEDQDLRHVSFSDISSKDWSQYKANHPDEYSPSPVKHENYDGRCKSRKYQFSHKYHHSSDYDRYGPSRHPRGRYFSRRNFHRKFFPRGTRGRLAYHPIASVMLDSRACLQQAEEKFRSGQITETEYIDLRRDLQKVAESSEYHFFKNYMPQKQEIEHYDRLSEIKINPQEHEPKQIESEDSRMQMSSVNPPSEKTFFLDGKERVLHFIDDKAIVLMDNNEPRELMFKDEQKKVYIDGMAEPLTLNFDGKSTEFELDGKRHVMRFGIPGRELYINNHPYEAQFGGPPLIAKLDDGRVYKMHLPGPAPQVVIGTKPQYELFAKHHDEAHKVQDSHIEYDIPPSSASIQDIDMRVKPNSASQEDILLNKDSPFYCKDMKDVDWRQLPPPTNVKETKNLPNVFNENVASSYETWINEDGLNSVSFEDSNNEVEKSVTKESLNYEWDMPENQQHPQAHVEQKQKQHIPSHVEQQKHHPPVHNGTTKVASTSTYLEQQKQHPTAHKIEHQKQHPVIQLQQPRPHPSEHFDLQKQHPPEFILEQRQYTLEHIKKPGQYAAEHRQEQQHQHPSVQQQQEEPLHSGKVSPDSTSEKWIHKQDNTYWQKDNYRKSCQPSYLEESTPYQPPQASSFEEENRYDHHPHLSYIPYAQRAPFQARHTRGRYPSHRYRPFNPDFERQWQYASPVDQPRVRFPVDQPRVRFPADHPRKSLLPPPPLPPPFLTTSVTYQTGVPSRDIQNQKRPGLLPTPGPSSEISPAEPSMPKMQVDIESLLQKLVAAGIINTKMYEEPEIIETQNDVTTDDKESDESSPEIEIELTAESLRINRPSVISALHKGLQCATCGMRFKEVQNDQYSRHLDWHFRMNRKEKDTKKAISRPWYYEVEDWIQFEEFEDFEERTPSYFELEAEDSQPEVVDIPAVVSVPATNDDQECCPVCLEKFQLFWVEDEEEWHYRNAVRHDNVTYHPACYEDYKKALEAGRSHRSLENIDSDNFEIEQEIISILNKVIDDVCKSVGIMETVPHQIDLPNVMEDVEVPPVEIHSEEEILEGKPGEEEIIGLISESDLETGSESPKAMSKMVVMQSGGITLKVKAESLQCHSPSNSSEKDTKVEDEKLLDDEDEIEFRPPTPDPNFEMQPTVSKGRELSGLCSIM